MLNQAQIERVNDALGHVRHNDGDTATISTQAVLYDISKHGQDEAIAKSIIRQILDHDGEDLEGKRRFKLMVSVSNITLTRAVYVDADDEDDARQIIDNDDDLARELMANGAWDIEGSHGTATITTTLFHTLTAEVDEVEETDETPEVPTAEAVTEGNPEPAVQSEYAVTFKYGAPTRYHEVTNVLAYTREEAAEFAKDRLPFTTAQNVTAWRAITDSDGAIPVRFSDGSV